MGRPGTAALRRTTRWTSQRPLLVVAAAAAAATALTVWLGPHGTDWAAHAFRTELFDHGGFSAWNNLWYEGHYTFITYSTLYYPLAWVFGMEPLAVICVGVSTLAFGSVVRRRWGESTLPATVAMGAMLALSIFTATLSFLLGVTFALLGLMALQRRRWVLYAAATLASALSSPLAFFFLGVVVVAIGIAERPDRRTMAIGLGVLVGVGVVILVLFALFASDARNPFPAEALVTTLVFCALLAAVAWRPPDARILLALAGVQAAAVLAMRILPTQLGEGVSRIRFFALPLVLLAVVLRRWRPWPACTAAVLVAAAWNLQPFISAFANGVVDPSEQAAYWRPAVDYVKGRLAPGQRVEVVDTGRHWAAYHFPRAGIPIVRGWFRQDDHPQNAILYRNDFSAAQFRAWLRSLGVRYVVLPDAELDYTAHREAQLLTDGTSGLRLVLRAPHVSVYEVPGDATIVTGPARPVVRAMGSESLALDLRAPGTYRIAVHYSPYWKPTQGCLSEGPDGMLRLRTAAAGPVRLSFDVDPGRFADVLTGGASESCAAR